MAFIRNQLPNFLTLCNLVCGYLGIMEVFQGSLTRAAYYMWAGLMFDFLDGLIARILGSTSPLGKQLDSLADLITFGFLPTVLMYQLIQQQNGDPRLAACSVLLLACAAIRLAKFNLDTQQEKVFFGLPSPAPALLISTYPTLLQNDYYPSIEAFIAHPYTMIGVVIVLSWLMVSPLQFLALKFTNLSWRYNRLRYFVMLTGVIAILVFRTTGLAYSTLLYIFCSILFQRSVKSM